MDDPLKKQQHGAMIILNLIFSATYYNRHWSISEAYDGWYQQDGVLRHNIAKVSQLLVQVVSVRWIANNDAFHWPARSPDLALLEFFVWEYIKKYSLCIKS